MKPSTIHLGALVLRHQRGTLTAIEQWISSQPPSPELTDLRDVISMMRKLLAAYERSLSGVEVT